MYAFVKIFSSDTGNKFIGFESIMVAARPVEDKETVKVGLYAADLNEKYLDCFAVCDHVILMPFERLGLRVPELIADPLAPVDPRQQELF